MILKIFLLCLQLTIKEILIEGVFEFYSRLIKAVPKIKIILYNFEKLSGLQVFS